jgi:hypothetical protein
MPLLRHIAAGLERKPARPWRRQLRQQRGGQLFGGIGRRGIEQPLGHTAAGAGTRSIRPARGQRIVVAVLPQRLPGAALTPDPFVAAPQRLGTQRIMIRRWL